MEVYCDLPSGWTLVGRFSNKDAKHWMKDANFWFDRISTYGDTLSPYDNADMISAAFWRTQGSEFKITRSDDSSHTALLETTNNCLKGATFREHVISVGSYRYEQAWASSKCQSRCSIKYGGKYQATSGFEKHNCSGGIQSSDYIGFWCHYSADGAVMMIGGGGSECNRADHGIGITEANAARFGGSLAFLDFGYQRRAGTGNNENEIEKTYALNLWVR